MFWQSTTFRFATLVFVLQLAAAAALLVALTVAVRDQIYADAADAEEVLRDELVDVRANAGEQALIHAINQRTVQAGGRPVVLLLIDDHGRKLAGNLGEWPRGLTDDRRHYHLELPLSGNRGPEAVLATTTRLPGNHRLLSGSVVEAERRVIWALEAATFIAIGLAVLFAVLAAWLAARMIGNRLRDTVATLEAVRGGDLAARVPQDRGGDAFAMLASAINATLARVESLVAELQMATDGLAHDLKSPIMRLRAALERAGGEAESEQARDAVGRAAQEADRLLALVQTSLRIVRAEAGLGRESFSEIDLRTMLEEIAELYGPLGEDAGRDIVVAPQGPVLFPVHRELLAQAIGNLVDNALKYGAGPIILAVAPERSGVMLSVSDRGPGIPERERARALSRFGRLDASRGGDGVGLGLSLVAAVARLHGGMLELADARPGLRAIIRLPAHPLEEPRSQGSLPPAIV